ncbi:tRNA lysidine(34) synthetase TilS [Herbiconiux sp. 11R-BC]|uniref:tRNA lysidine(34) synthetase n=1 Tax=Herbiconiux sp. 11R-BC TaxID=3111637 RepID=UPI003BFFAF4B
MNERRPRLTPAMADVRRAVRECLEAAGLANGAAVLPAGAGASAATREDGDGILREQPGADVLVALSGGPDSLALAAATAFEAPRAGIRAGAIIVDHGLQDGSDAVAAEAARQAGALGLAPVLVTRVRPAEGSSSVTGGVEAAARDARYAAIDDALRTTGAHAVLLGHTLDDQAETVLLGLARGAGAASLAGMATVTGPPDADGDAHASPASAAPPASGGLRAPAVPRGARLRPLLGIRRSETEAFCADSGLEPWHDPHNADERFTRVRVRRTVLPVLEAELGPGIAEALARTAEQLREDDDALHAMAIETIEEIVEPAEAGIAISVAALEANPPALRNRIIRYVVDAEFGVSLSRVQTLAAVALVTGWHGQKGVDLPGIRVVRQAGRLVFSAAANESQNEGNDSHGHH